ncbi:branched-chain amino acid ABC transporter permease [Microvirga pakistanensis]|uniref:branched-chain amino acid ABC transporter permease n=1 Tax=Microvirga pakistanensis TaxID=1682650 RepID=UPI00106D0DE0|nr:branched-chain amino acid ABC transporter permease [Microvirga pakistanensis]
MTLDYIAIAILSSLSTASILLIATLGLAIVFGLMGVINLAHGEMIMFGAYAALLSTRLGVPFPLAVLLATGATALFGAVVEILIIRRLYGRMLDTMLATWGLSLALYQSAVLAFGSVTPGIGMPQMTVRIGQYGVSAYMVFLIFVAVSCVAGLFWLLTRTGYGIMARAAIADAETASAIGIESSRMNTVTFALGAGLAGFAGAILLPVFPATPSMGFALAIKAFLAVVVAGPLPLSGTVTAIGTLGTAGGITSSIWSTAAGDLFFFGTTILILRLWPNGISSLWRYKL